MTYHITAPHLVQASIALPASKSISNRVLILHALAQGPASAQGTHMPQNLSECDDTAVMIRALAPYGGADRSTADPRPIDIKAAGTAMRFLTAYLSVSPGRYLLTGTQRMQQRPIRILVDALRKLGAHIAYAGQEGFPPLLIEGRDPQACATTTVATSTAAPSTAAPSTAAPLQLPGSVSSQYISALLMIGPLRPGGLRLELTGRIISRPYIDLTLSLMRNYGADAQWTDERTLTVAPGRYADTPFVVESDWSAASYWYQMLALCAHCRRLHPMAEEEEKPSAHEPAGDELPRRPYVELLGLFADSYQGDSRVAELFGRLGIRTEFTEQGVRLSPMGLPVARLVEDMTDTPDLAQTVVVTCCLMGIPFRLTGLQSLRIKETDRIAALITELHRLGYVVREEPASGREALSGGHEALSGGHEAQSGILVWNGERSPLEPQAVIQTYDDHRMAMAFAPVALMGTPINIAHPEVVTKSYPTFWQHLKDAGFAIEEQ